MVNLQTSYNINLIYIYYIAQYVLYFYEDYLGSQYLCENCSYDISAKIALPLAKLYFAISLRILFGDIRNIKIYI